MLAYLQDQAALLVIPFTEQGEPFIPDASSVTWSLRDHSGALVTGFVNEPLTVGPTDIQVNIQVPALQNAIQSPRRFEKRTIILNATRQGLPWSRVIQYRVTPWLNHTVTPDYVRNLGGLDRDELADHEMDIWSAYLYLEKRVTAARLDEALTSGTESEALLNRAIAAKTMLDVMPMASNRVLKRRNDGSIQAERFKFDRDLIEKTLKGYIEEAVESLVGTEGASTILMSFGTPTDPITGGA